MLRAERGFIIVGQDTDGTVTPDDLGMAGMIARTKSDFVGKRSLARADLTATGRKQLVGLLTHDAGVVLEEGAQAVLDRHRATPMKILGHVTSSYWSQMCERSIALALIDEGRALQGETVHVTTPKGFAAATVMEPNFFDAGGERVSG